MMSAERSRRKPFYKRPLFLILTLVLLYVAANALNVRSNINYLLFKDF